MPGTPPPLFYCLFPCQCLVPVKINLVFLRHGLFISDLADSLARLASRLGAARPPDASPADTQPSAHPAHPGPTDPLGLSTVISKCCCVVLQRLRRSILDCCIRRACVCFLAGCFAIAKKKTCQPPYPFLNVCFAVLNVCFAVGVALQFACDVWFIVTAARWLSCGPVHGTPASAYHSYDLFSICAPYRFFFPWTLFLHSTFF
jgi:hypothetical protein